MSSSRQFVVHGSDRQLRGAICELAERCKRHALRLLGLRDVWQTPVVIRAESQPRVGGIPLAQLHVSQTGVGLKFQLDLRLAHDLKPAEIEREVLRAIFLEMMYRAQPELPAGTPYVEPPEWLLEGVAALASERDSAVLTQTLVTAAAGRLLPLDDFLRQQRALLDSPSRVLYRAYAAALVSLLVEGEEGRARLARFVADLARAPNDSFAGLVEHFPALGGNKAQVEERWRAQVVRFAGSERFRVLNCAETDRALAEILRVKVPVENQTTVYALEEFPRFLRQPAAATDLKRVATELMLLSARAHPVYRPIVGEYRRIVARLGQRRAPKLVHLAELRAMREHLNREMDVIADYLNWFEATQARTTSGVFREYLSAAESLLESEPRRRDPISVYLDALETQF